MLSTQDKWIRIFDVPEVSKHKNGFTLYKIVSMLYPEACPDAVTKVTVWKRFNDFKKLYHSLKIIHKGLKQGGKFPSLPTKTVFKRFSNETIQERKRSIQSFLDFIGNNQQLFTSNEFVKFLETSHTPVDHLNSNINVIRAELNLPEDPEVTTNLSNSDDDKTISDTDSVTTMGSLSPSVQTDIFSEVSVAILQNPGINKLSSLTSVTSHPPAKNTLSTCLDNITLLDGVIYPPSHNAPHYGESVQYIIDASVHINLGNELENNKQYEEAYVAFKTAVDILLKFGKEDPNYDRRQMIKYKCDKYILKAEKIYNMYLAPEIRNLENTNKAIEQTNAKRPLFDLYKFKVVKIIGSGMLVLHSELQQLFYIKVIHKTVEFSNNNIILPENVPYMIKLRYHYNCENALFLVLEYCCGTNLRDYLKTHSTYNENQKDTEILKQIQDMSDNESEISFSDLINNYASTRDKNLDLKEEGEINNLLSVEHNRDEVLKNIIDQSQILSISVDSSLINKDMETMDEEVHEIFNQGELSKAREEFSTSLVLPEETVVTWAAQLLLALEKLHASGVICRDLQIKNLLVNENGSLILTYMCNVKELGDLYSKEINYNLAPEVYGFQEITTAADWWSYGAILYELLVGVPLSEVHMNGLTSFSHLKIPNYVSPEGKSLLRQLLMYESHNRLGSGINGNENIKSHPFFNTISWNSLLSTFHSEVI